MPVQLVVMKRGPARVRPDEYILAALSPEERLDAALRVAREAFKESELTVADVEAAVRKVRRKRHGARNDRPRVAVDTSLVVSTFAPTDLTLRRGASAVAPRGPN